MTASDPPVGKDSSFEELLDAFRKAARKLYELAADADPSYEELYHDELTAARAALLRYVTELQEDRDELESRVDDYADQVVRLYTQLRLERTADVE